MGEQMKIITILLGICTLGIMVSVCAVIRCDLLHHIPAFDYRTFGCNWNWAVLGFAVVWLGCNVADFLIWNAHRQKTPDAK